MHIWHALKIEVQNIEFAFAKFVDRIGPSLTFMNYEKSQVWHEVSQRE